MARRPSKRTSTRDIAVDTQALCRAHIKECDRDRQLRAEQRREDIQRQNDQHVANQTLLAGQAEEAKRSREEIMRRLDAGSTKMDQLAAAISTGDKEVETQGAKWRDRVMVGLIVILVAVVGYGIDKFIVK